MPDRTLVLAPRGRDSAITCRVLAGNGIQAEACSSIAALVQELDGAGTALITEESLTGPDTAELSRWVADQPRWSDFPFVVLAAGGHDLRRPETFDALEALGNVVLLERPVHIEALVRAVRSALKARRRQREVKAFAQTLEDAVAARTRDLEGAQRSLQLALDAAEMGSWDLDLETGQSQRNLRHDQIFGYSAPLPQWGLDTMIDHVALHDRAAVADAFDRARTEGVLQIECAIEGGDHKTRWIAAKGRTQYDAEGRPVRMSGVVTDISARKEADAQLAHSQKMDTIGHLTGGVAHDFNNLLTPIMASLDMLRRRNRDPRDQRLIGAALQATERAATLTQRLLAFARRQALEPKAVNIVELIDGLTDLMRRTLGPSIEVTVETPRGSAAALVDPNQLELALLNLAVNARDAMPAGGRLRVEVTEHVLDESNDLRLPPGRYLRISTEDSGTGMDEETLQRAVEPFFSTKGLGKGTGLGLSMVHGLAAQSGGSLQLRSSLGRGTTVELWLPATEDIAEAAPSEVDIPPLTGRASILLVDDEDLVRRATADMMTDLGYQVLQAASGAEALDLIRSGARVDFVVTDYLMPGMSGAAFIRELQESGLEIPALLITGYANTAGDVPIDVPRLAKPFKQRDLAARLYALAHRRRGRPQANG